MAPLTWYAQNAAHEDALQDLLESSNSWINPNQVYLEAAYHLGELGFIQLTEQYFIKCANPLDALDFDSLINPDCENKIAIADDFDESCDDLMCEECGRYILPISHQKQSFHVVSLSLKKQVLQMLKYKQISSQEREKIEESVAALPEKSPLIPVLQDYMDLLDKLKIANQAE